MSSFLNASDDVESSGINKLASSNSGSFTDSNKILRPTAKEFTPTKLETYDASSSEKSIFDKSANSGKSNSSSSSSYSSGSSSSGKQRVHHGSKYPPVAAPPPAPAYLFDSTGLLYSPSALTAPGTWYPTDIDVTSPTAAPFYPSSHVLLIPPSSQSPTGSTQYYFGNSASKANKDRKHLPPR